MSKGPFFIKSKIRLHDWATCDDCGRKINDVSDDSYWNPNPRAIIRNICADCYAFRMKRKQERWNKRLAQLAEMKEEGKEE